MRRQIPLVMLGSLMFLMGQDCVPDSDSDGVGDSLDACPNTPLCASVDSNGCPSDSDDDGVHNGCDACTDTPAGETVYGNGCSVEVGDPEGGVPSRCPGPDPRAKEIEYSLMERIDDVRARIKIKGRVENFGLSDYASVPGRQSMQLWEDNTMVAEQAFEDLAVDEVVFVEYERDWVLAGAEFLPERYTLLVTYDPDIRDDGIATNDDCREGNNMILRGTGDIVTLFD